LSIKVSAGTAGAPSKQGTSSASKSTIFWDITPCSPLNVNRPATWFLAQLIFEP
jgi:hypothetical protein